MASKKGMGSFTKRFNSMDPFGDDDRNKSPKSPSGLKRFLRSPKSPKNNSDDKENQPPPDDEARPDSPTPRHGGNARKIVFSSSATNSTGDTWDQSKSSGRPWRSKKRDTKQESFEPSSTGQAQRKRPKDPVTGKRFLDHIRSSSWFKPPDPEINSNRIKSTAGFAFSSRTKGKKASTYQTVPGKRTASGVRWADQNPGVIVARYCVMECDSPRVPDDAEGVFWVAGQRYIRKRRYFIIVGRTEKQVQEMPIFTFHDQGLEGHEAALKYQYISVIPHGVSAVGFKNQSPGNPMVKIETVINDGELGRRTMVAHYTETVPRKVNWPDLELKGKLSAEDTDVVVKLAQNSLGKGPRVEV